MMANSGDRLARMEVMLESVINTQANQLTAIESLVKSQQSTDAKLNELIAAMVDFRDGQLALQELGGLIAGETRQLKRAVDYLMSKDGERG